MRSLLERYCLKRKGWVINGYSFQIYFKIFSISKGIVWDFWEENLPCIVPCSILLSRVPLTKVEVGEGVCIDGKVHLERYERVCPCAKSLLIHQIFPLMFAIPEFLFGTVINYCLRRAMKKPWLVGVYSGLYYPVI